MSSTIGILSYGTALPRWSITAQEVASAYGVSVPALGVRQKTVAGRDEDAATLAVDAAHEALLRIPEKKREVTRRSIEALWVGSESHPYAVKPTGTIVATALGLNEQVSLADLQFACKAGTQSMQIAAAYVKANMATVALAIGSDTAQSRPGDLLEYTAAAGAGAYLIGKGSDVIVELIDTLSVASDLPDFWRRNGQAYPEHAGRFTGEPAYFAQIQLATKKLLAKTGLQPREIDYVVFHTPNGKFPEQVAKQLGFQPEQIAPSLLVSEIGNTYTAAVPLALAATLDQIEANKTILMCSYGSGAGADVFLWKTTSKLLTWRNKQMTTTSLLRTKVAQLQPISYTEYQQRQGEH